MDQIKTKVVKINEAYRRMREEELSFSLEDRNRPQTLTDEDRKVLEEAAAVIRNGGLAAFPTETVYGLGANALDEKAAKKIYEAKGRPSDNPLIAHIADLDGLKPLVSEIPEAGRKLAEAFWPGPLTLVFPKSRIVPHGTTGGLETVAVRMPSDPVARELIRLAGVPIAAPSANTSGRPSPTRAEHVFQDMDGKIDLIVDGGPVGIGVESTIVDVTEEIPTLLRPGAITMEMLGSVVGKVDVDPAITGPLRADVKPPPPAPRGARQKIPPLCAQGVAHSGGRRRGGGDGPYQQSGSQKAGGGPQSRYYLHRGDQGALSGRNGKKHRPAGRRGDGGPQPLCCAQRI